MQANWLNQLGDWNPQILRESKGRLHKRNVILVIAISFFMQFGVFLYFQSLLPNSQSIVYSSANRYCTGKYLDIAQECFLDNYGNANINWQLWFQDIFNWLSILVFFAIIVGGSYLLINDLSTEERRDTLNFIRLSPQSPQSILVGKMLGVPILIYLGVCLAIPLHLWLGLNAKISLILIFSFYIIVITTSLFYFSGAILFGLIGSWLGGFQAWLGSGLVLGFLLITQQTIVGGKTYNDPLVVLNFMNPYYFIPGWESSLFTNIDLVNFSWLTISIGNSWGKIIVFGVLLHLVGAYFFWQSLQRCFRDRNATMLSKQQSYLLTIAFTVITIGCINWSNVVFGQVNYTSAIPGKIASLMFLNLWLFLYLIAAITPHRQTLQDWVRYRHIADQQGEKQNVIPDLIWGEKSPGVVAIAVNAIITITGLSLLIIISNSNYEDKFNSLIALMLAGSLAMIYAALTQLLLLMKHGQKLFLTNGVLGAVIILPVFALSILFSYPAKQTFLWLFSVAAPLVALYSSNYLSPMTALLAIMAHAGILSLMLFQITRQLKRMGESGTKMLLGND